MSSDTALRPLREEGGLALATSRAEEAIRQAIGALPNYDEVQLRLAWRNEAGRRVSLTLPRYLLIRMLAYRIQANQFGDLESASVQALERKGVRTRGGDAKSDSRPIKTKGVSRVLKPGSILVREWKDELHSVTVTHDGFEWQGSEYRSLSTVAKAITGTAWSGPRFFGLHDPLQGKRGTA